MSDTTTTSNRVTRRSYNNKEFHVSIWADGTYYLHLWDKHPYPIAITRWDANRLIRTMRKDGKVERYVTTSYAL